MANRLGLEPSVRAGRIGLSIPAGLPFDTWEKIGDQLRVIGDSSAWWLGDWLVYGETSFPDRYRLAISQTHLAYKTLRNYAWVARNVPMSRRRDALSLQHHAQVAALSGDEQERWLARAEEEGWPQSRLRKEIQASRARTADSEPIKVAVTVHISFERERRWRAAAQVASVSLPEWIAHTLDHAAGHVDGDMAIGASGAQAV
ncbi:LmbU and cloE [Nonomuraea mesophila]|uniref:LmbU and cloE n=1 Tax=Nonomuraea mesophila TaxID=2530382 RepID=A0A4V2Z7A8_9ACTN|nr:LmbU family transcriptional regulator [Nonomuraea mesophila]TDE35746.1 LmbU and cloE [Nonomuraea mesophila]